MNKPLNRMNPQELGSLFPIFLTKHNPAWSELFLQEKDLIAGRLVQEKKCAEDTLRIRHIGSTSIPGIMAKPTIDILLEITDATNCDHLIREIKNLGYHYIPKPENPPPHMMFVKGYTPEGFRGQSYHLHVRYRGDWDEPYFRNYLSAHPLIAKEYEDLKISLAKKFRYDRDGYTAAKAGFISRVNECARIAAMPVIETKRLNIRPLTCKELEAYAKDLMGADSPDDVAMAEAICNDLLPCLSDHRNHPLFYTMWIMTLQNTPTQAGALCFHGAPDTKGVVEIGYGTEQEFRNKGLMTEAVAAMIEWMRTCPAIKTVVANTTPDNPASVRVLEKNGFNKKGRNSIAAYCLYL